MQALRGSAIALRLVQPKDAGYIHALRINPTYNQHLSAVTGTADDQRQWIKSYKLREAKGLEYYFVIERLDGIPCGVVRLYDISAEHFTWGSWILDHNKPPKAALESAVLSFDFGFERLSCKKAILDVRIENTHARSFYHRFGAEEVGQDVVNKYFELTREKFFQNHSLARQEMGRGLNETVI